MTPTDKPHEHHCPTEMCDGVIVHTKTGHLCKDHEKPMLCDRCFYAQSKTGNKADSEWNPFQT